MPAIIAALVAYLVGSISTAVIVCRVMGLEDPRTTGSKNPGATNVLRLGGKLPAALTLLGDALKGLLPVVITAMITQHPPTIALAAIAAFLGHVYPIFFDFEGGKGVATAFGALFGIDLTVGLLAILTWVATTLVFRMSSLAALLTFLLVPIYLLTSGKTIFAAGYLLIGLVLFYRHRANIQRILSGTEPKL
ncbi:MAG: glycerol-3-phosphate 1-O-acyltransferase PlsY [Gammaproteobacteria bacterium]|nr:glycerol-3-phosphate 1-O-acyltransferase PlsY [Gammaproteobacteria bacterium]